jgi:hypothetical protein
VLAASPSIPNGEVISSEKERPMARRGTTLAFFSLLILVSLAFYPLQGMKSQSTGDHHQITRPDSLTWVRSGGVQLAVLSGDPDKPGPFTIRLKIKDGYRVMPHWHPQDESVTTIQGVFLMGMGDKFAPAELEQMPVGSYALMPKGMHHFASSAGETIVQVHGMGPFVTNYLNPADDPENKKQ